MQLPSLQHPSLQHPAQFRRGGIMMRHGGVGGGRGVLGGLKGDANRDLEWQSAERREINVMLGCFFSRKNKITHTHTQRQEAWRKMRRCSNKCLIVLDVSFDFLVMPRRVTSQRHRQGGAAAAARTPPQRHCTLKGFCRQRRASHLPGCAFQGCRGGGGGSHEHGAPSRGTERPRK